MTPFQIYILKVKWHDGHQDYLDWTVEGAFKSKWGAMAKVDELKANLSNKFQFTIDIQELQE